MSGYDFSPVYPSQTIAFSPGSTFLATAAGPRIIIRSVSTLNIVRTWLIGLDAPSASSSKSQGGSTITDLQWSKDGHHLLAFSKTAQIAWVFGLADDGSGDSGEIARIAGGVEGLVKVEWVRGGKDVFAWSEHTVSGRRAMRWRRADIQVEVDHPQSPGWICEGHPACESAVEYVHYRTLGRSDVQCLRIPPTARSLQS